MSKKFKKLMCSLLALAMVASSGIAVLADEPAATTAETAVTETVAETEVTAEPTAVPDPYASDSYYQKALGLCSALGIITGYDDGSVKPESTVTRAEMAAIILRMTALSSLSTYRNLYTDVTSSHWAANTIQTASDEGVINGMGDGTFNPDGDVLYEQALKMIVCGMNYDNEAEMKGGYPNGYLAVAATNLSLLDGVKGSIGVAVPRGEIIKMVYNALIGPYNDLKTYENGQPVYSSTETLAKAKFDLFEDKGLLTGTSTTTIAGSEPDAGKITIDGETFLCSLTDLDGVVGNKVTYYYRDNGKSDPEVLAVITDPAKTKEVTIKSDEIDELKGFEDGKGIIETYDGEEYETVDATVVYNGDMIDADLYNSVAAVESSNRFDLIGCDGENYTESTGKKMTYDEFIRPRVGSVRLVDNDGDNKYDVVFVTSVETLVITAATDKKVTGKINNIATTIDVDNTSLDKTISVLKDGSEAKPKNLKKNEVVSLTRNIDNDVLSFEQVENSITGKISSFTAAEMSEYAVVVINGQEYKVDVNAINDCATGVEGTFTLDKYNRVAYITSDSVITASEKYGWILSAYTSDSGDDYIVRMFTQDGQAVDYTLGTKVSYWAPNATEPASYSTDEMKNILNRGGYKSMAFSLGDTDGDGVEEYDNVEIRLVKFSTNSKNEITKLYCTTAAEEGYTKDTEYSDENETYNKNALTMNFTNMNGRVSTGNMLGSMFYMSDGMLEITVPNKSENSSDPSNYSVATVNASAYLDKENGIGKDCIFGEFSDSKQTYPTVVIRFVGASDEAAATTDYGTANNHPCFMVKKIFTGVDDDDNVVYTIVGYQNGGEVRYETKQNTTLAKRTGLFAGSADYVSTKLWDAVEGMTSAGASMYPGAEDLTDLIGVGDILGVAGDGTVLMMMVDASEFAEQVRSGDVAQIYNEQDPGKSSSRDNIYMGMVADSDLNESAIMSVAGYKVLFDAGRAMDTLIIDEAGELILNTENVSTIADVVDYDEAEGYGDYAFVRYANKGNLQEIYLFRFED